MSLFIRTDEPLDHCLAERLTPLDAARRDQLDELTEWLRGLGAKSAEEMGVLQAERPAGRDRREDRSIPKCRLRPHRRGCALFDAGIDEVLTLETWARPKGNPPPDNRVEPNPGARDNS